MKSAKIYELKVKKAAESNNNSCGFLLLLLLSIGWWFFVCLSCYFISFDLEIKINEDETAKLVTFHFECYTYQYWLFDIWFGDTETNQIHWRANINMNGKKMFSYTNCFPLLIVSFTENECNTTHTHKNKKWNHFLPANKVLCILWIELARRHWHFLHFFIENKMCMHCTSSLPLSHCMHVSH